MSEYHARLFSARSANGALVGQELLEQRHHRSAHVRDKAVPHLADILELAGLIAAYNQCVERIPGCIAANDKFLRLMDLVVDPSPTAAARLVE